eukprot:TRINITY_DN273_c0_g1_i1.p1 TRINITY_DN273_c0_g1~~TRINITY_DN273_c0_g1_i1.p1  ORF type:complete len:153 (-),score=40.62 TRINITY_DN273_c0_g1_i1:162-620(-)
MNRKYDKPPTFRLYAVLGVNSFSTEEEVKKAYRKLALQYHPDKVGPNADPETMQKINDINLAYSVLSDPEKRAAYFTYGDYSLDDVELEEAKSGAGLPIKDLMENAHKIIGKAVAGLVVNTLLSGARIIFFPVTYISSWIFPSSSASDTKEE